MPRAFEAERTANTKLWVPEKKCAFGRKIQCGWSTKYTVRNIQATRDGKLCTLYGLERARRNL